MSVFTPVTKRCATLPALFILIVGVCWGPALAADRVNMLPNAGFEQGMPEPWYVYHTGEYKVVRNPREARSGDYYAAFSWRKPPGDGAYSALWACAGKAAGQIIQFKVYPGVTYRAGVWAKGTGSIQIWTVAYTNSGRFMGTSFGKSRALTEQWKFYERTWTAAEGILHGMMCLTVAPGTVASFDDADFSYDGETFTPPEAESLPVVPMVKAHRSTARLYLNNRHFDAEAKIHYGEQIVAVEATAAGPEPGLSGSIRFGRHDVRLDDRWRAAPMPAGDTWRKSGFDDRTWKRVKAAASRIWDAEGSTKIALRRTVLWKSSRKAPHRTHQWLSMMRDRMFVAEGSAGAFVHILPAPGEMVADELTLHIEAPSFLTLLDRFEMATSHHSNWAYKTIQRSQRHKDGVDTTHFVIRYDIPQTARWRAHAPLYFKAADKIARDMQYTFRFWREANGNVTDLPMDLPITVTGPVNGRQCRHFHLSYNRPVMMHTGGFGTFSLAERHAMADTLIAAGMNVAFASLEERNGVVDYFLSLKQRGVQLVWGFNIGMNWPGGASKLLEQHPEFAGRFYDGSTQAFEDGLGYRRRDMTGKVIWCQEYLASGGTVFFDSLRPRYERAREKLGDILYTMWDWEYATFAWSCFCSRCKAAFGKTEKIPKSEELSDEIIVTKYPEQWVRFRLEQSARHQLAMTRFCREYDIMLTNWHPGFAVRTSDFDYSLLGDSYAYHFMGWPGNDLPLMGMGRRGGPGASWKKQNPDIHLVAQTIVDRFPSHVIDERMFKIWTLNAALGTHGGGWLFWLDSMYPLPQSHGMSYFIGEATRLIHDFEVFFMESEHIESSFQQRGLEGNVNELIALQGPNGKEALVLLFNQSDGPAEVTVTVKAPNTMWNSVAQWEGRTFQTPGSVTVTVPEKDVIALLYR